MYVNFTPHKPHVFGSSCSQQIAYLSKEDNAKEEVQESYFFNNDRQDITLHQAIDLIDSNKGSHSNSQSKFYMINISPSKGELSHIEGLVDTTLSQREFQNQADYIIAKDITMRLYLQEYVNYAMELYAENFDRDLSIDDLVYAAKIEQNRTYKITDYDVKHNVQLDKFIKEDPANKQDLQEQYKRNSKGDIIRKGMGKQGLNYHAHVLVSRYEKNRTVRSKRSLSPLSKGKISTGLNNSKVGFNRDAFNEKLHARFDIMMNYQRPIFERYAYHKEKSSTAQDYTLAQLQFQSKLYVKEFLQDQGLLVKELPLSLRELQGKILRDLDRHLQLSDIKDLARSPKQQLINKTVEFVKEGTKGLDLGM